MAITRGTFLDQSLKFNFTDLSVLLDKVRTGDVRSVSGYGNNVVDVNLDRNAISPFLFDELGKVQLDIGGTPIPNPNYDPALANGSAFNEFISISGANTNYPGDGPAPH